MKALGINSDDFMRENEPFVYCYKKDNNYYIEILVKVDSDKTVEIIQSSPLLYTVTIQNSDSILVDKKYKLFYYGPEIINEQSECSWVIVTTNNGMGNEESGKAIVKYRDTDLPSIS